MKLTVYVLYYDYGADEGCSPPEKVVTALSKAEAWATKDEYVQRIWSEFEIEVPERERE